MAMIDTKTQSQELVKIGPKQPMMAGSRPMPIVPQSLEDCFRLASAIVKARMTPRGIDTPEQAMVIIMRGLEVGLTPFQALDKIALVNGRPTIWGDGALALVLASGLCEDIIEHIEGQGDERTAICRTMRKGRANVIVGEFSVARAKQAGLWGKSGPWQQYPDRMLQMRARAFAMRDGYADVLGGLYMREEFDVSRTTRPSLDSCMQALSEDPPHDPETGEIYQNGAHPAPQAAPGDRLPENAAEYDAGGGPANDAPPASVTDGEEEFKDDDLEWLMADAREMALSGRRTFDSWYNSLKPMHQHTLAPHMKNLMNAANKTRGK